jgi:hypothetical protein
MTEQQRAMNFLAYWSVHIRADSQAKSEMEQALVSAFRAAISEATAAKDAEIAILRERKCEGCGLHGDSVKYIRVHVTNGVLTLCRQCLDDVNRKNPATAAAIARAEAAEAEVARQQERMKEMAANDLTKPLLVQMDTYKAALERIVKAVDNFWKTQDHELEDAMRAARSLLVGTPATPTETTMLTDLCNRCGKEGGTGHDCVTIEEAFAREAAARQERIGPTIRAGYCEDRDAVLGHTVGTPEVASTPVKAPAAPTETTEEDRRIYYQDIVYAVCNALDRCFVKRPGKGIVCGTVEAPSKQVQEHMAIVVERCIELANRQAAEQAGDTPTRPDADKSMTDSGKPAYIVWKGFREWNVCDSLVKALEAKSRSGGLIYEPMGMTTAVKVSSELAATPDPNRGKVVLVADPVRWGKWNWINQPSTVHDLCNAIYDAVAASLTTKEGR